VNGTWFFSLGLTLISALAAVLAKGWLAQYTPATPGLRSKDACERHLRRLRYLRSREWRLAMIVAGIPLLIQIALLLFAVGLVVFTASDDSGISITLSVMTALTTCLYFLGTVLPWFSPACPFQTTMSDIIPGVAANRRYADSPEKQPPALRQPLSALQRAHLQWRKLTEFLKKTHHKPDRRQMEADVLAWMLTSSTDEKAIEEAVRAVAGANPTDDYLRDALCESSATETLCQRFSRQFKIAPGMVMSADDAPHAEPYLYALLHIVVPSRTARDGSEANSGQMRSVYRLLMQPEQPLHRWDHFVEHLQPLACALRIRLLLAADEDDHTEQLEQRTLTLINMTERGFIPHVRRILVNAALEGLRLGQIRMRRMCGIILCKQFQIRECAQ
jgi:hypothetical protein